MLKSRYILQRLLVFKIPDISHSCAHSTDLHFKQKFSEEDQAKILNIINQNEMEHLLKFDMSRRCIRNLEIWRLKHGPFRSILEILEVEGMGEKLLEKLCDSIVLNKFSDKNLKPTARNRKQFISPPFDTSIINRLDSAVGIHASATGFSWAKLNYQSNEVIDWNFQDLSFLPKKLLPSETYDLAVKILNKLPNADVYVMEAMPAIGPQNPQATKPPTYNQQIELISMLLALLNSSAKHGCIERLENGGMENGEVVITHNKVYFMRAYLSARLFKTLVGNEKVTSSAIMSKLLDASADLPCTAIRTSAEIRSRFWSQSSVHKDLLGHALMLIVCFMDLCVYKNAVSLQIINKRGAKN